MHYRKTLRFELQAESLEALDWLNFEWALRALTGCLSPSDLSRRTASVASTIAPGMTSLIIIPLEPGAFQAPRNAITQEQAQASIAAEKARRALTAEAAKKDPVGAVPHPGAILRERMNLSGLTPETLSAATSAVPHGGQVSAPYIERILDGEANISPSAAQAFADTLGPSKEFWLTVDAKYRPAQQRWGAYTPPSIPTPPPFRLQEQAEDVKNKLPDDVFSAQELQRALESWKETFFSVWHENAHMGPRQELLPHIPQACIPGLGTVRECRICGCLIAGGPTACKRCAAEPGPEPEPEPEP